MLTTDESKVLWPFVVPMKAPQSAICNNDGERAAAILACCAKGIHAIAEKPLAINPQLLAVPMPAPK